MVLERAVGAQKDPVHNRPFLGPEQVFRYLARYTHRIAIPDSRIVSFDGENVSFRHRKPAEPGQKKPRYGIMAVSADEFI